MMWLMTILTALPKLASRYSLATCVPQTTNLFAVACSNEVNELTMADPGIGARGALAPCLLLPSLPRPLKSSEGVRESAVSSPWRPG